MDPVAIIAVFAGGVIALVGYRMFLDLLRLWGFLLIGVLGAYLSIQLFPQAGGAFHLSVPLVGGFLIGGLVGALVARPLKVVIVFLTGFLAGYAIVTTCYNLIFTTLGMLSSGNNPSTVTSDFRLVWGGPSFVIALLVGAVVGAVSIRWEDIALIISMAFIGAAIMIYGIITLLGVPQLIAVIIFFLIGLFGAAAQYTDAQRNR
jgi:hypothetical protein